MKKIVSKTVYKFVLFKYREFKLKVWESYFLLDLRTGSGIVLGYFLRENKTPLQILKTKIKYFLSVQVFSYSVTDYFPSHYVVLYLICVYILYESSIKSTIQ